MVNLSNPGCTAAGALQLPFMEYVKQCTTSNDTARALNFLKFQEIKEQFEKERAQADSLLRSIQNIRSLKTSKKMRDQDTAEKNRQIDDEIQEAKEELANLTSQTDAANEQFMETVVDAPKESSRFANYQDLAIGSFFGSFLILTIILMIIQYMRPDGGGWTAVKTLGGMIVIGIIIFAILREIG